MSFSALLDCMWHVSTQLALSTGLALSWEILLLIECIIECVIECFIECFIESINECAIECVIEWIVQE